MSASGILSSNVSQKFSSIPLAVRLGSVVVRMKTINEVLLQKELELVRVGKELDALRIAAPLLRGDEADVDSQPAFVSWWERWRHETATRFFPVASLRKHF